MTTTNIINTIQEKNTKVLRDISVAQTVMDTLKKNPELANYHNPILSKLGDSRWNGHYVADKFHEIINTFGDPEYTSYNTIMGNKDIAPEIKTFFRDAHNYFNKNLN